MDRRNETFNISIENTEIQIVIHYESFEQSVNDIARAPHSHIYYEFQYSLNDNNLLFVDSKKSRFKKNSFAIIPPCLKHKSTFECTSDLMSFGFNFKKIPNKAGKNDTFTFFNERIGNNFVSGELDDSARELFSKLYYHAHRNDPINNGFLISSILHILYTAISAIPAREAIPELIPEETANDIPQSYCPKGVPIETLYEINETLSRKYMDEITPSSLSRQFFVSPKQINRYISKQYGKTFLQRRTELRMMAAQKLLAESDAPIGKISEIVGYRSINTFYSAFRNYCGSTPDIYRKENGLHFWNG